MPAPHASSSITMRVELDSDPRGIGCLTTAVGEGGGTVTAVDVVESHPNRMVVDLTCNASDAEHAEAIANAVDRVDAANPARSVTSLAAENAETWQRCAGTVAASPAVPVSRLLVEAEAVAHV